MKNYTYRFRRNRIFIPAFMAVSVLLCGYTSSLKQSVPKRPFEKTSPPSEGYSYYSGTDKSPGDLWNKETIMIHPQTGKKVTLLGMIHIADKEFYDYVQGIIDEHDVVLAEGLSGSSSLSISTFFYSYIFSSYDRIAHHSNLSLQNGELDIPPEKCVSADINIQDMQQFNSAKSNAGMALFFPVALLVYEPYLLMLDLKETLGETPDNERKRIAALRHFLFSESETDQEAEEQAEEILKILMPGTLAPRNERLMDVFNEQAESDDITSILIPWGADHLQEIEEGLLEQGYEVSESKWVKAIAVKGLLDNNSTLNGNRVINIPYLYSYYKYSKMSNHRFLFQSIDIAYSDTWKAVDLGYGQIMHYSTGSNSSDFSLFPRLFNRPLFFSYSKTNKGSNLKAFLFFDFTWGKGNSFT